MLPTLLIRPMILLCAGWLAWGAAPAAAQSPAAAQPANARDQAAATTVTFWTMQLSPFHDDYVKGVIRDFERQHPQIRVKWVDVPWAEMEKKVLASLAAGTPPDVVNLNPQFSSKLAEFGALADPRAHLSADEIAAYLPQAWNANQLDGRIFALPWYLTTNVLLYNTRIFASAGQTVPRTHDELITAARAIHARTGQYAYFPALDGSTPLENLVAMGAPLLDGARCAPGFVGDAGTAGEQVFSHYRDLYQDKLVPRNVVTEGHRKAVEMFLSGQVAMVSTGIQFLQYIKNSNPSLYADIGVAPQLSAPGIAPNIAAMNVGVLSASKSVPAAFRFATFVTNAANQSALARRVAVLPSTVASYRDDSLPAARKSDDALLDAARALSIRQVLAGQVLVPPMRHYNKLRASYARNLQAVMLGRAPIDTALARVNRDWRAALGCAT